MKKGLVIVLSFLLSFALLVTVIKIGDIDFVSSGSTNKSKNDVNQDQIDPPNDDSGSNEQLSWIDPETGIDIFAYDNILDFEDGERRTISLGTGDVYEENAVLLYADESLLVPSVIYNDPEGHEFNVSDYSSYEIALGTYALDIYHKYYFYYSRDINGGYERCGLGMEDASDGVYDVDFAVWNTSFMTQYIEFGFGWLTISESGEFQIVLRNGLKNGTEPNMATGKFYLRVIAVPNT